MGSGAGGSGEMAAGVDVALLRIPWRENRCARAAIRLVCLPCHQTGQEEARGHHQQDQRDGGVEDPRGEPFGVDWRFDVRIRPLVGVCIAAIESVFHVDARAMPGP